MKRRHLTMILLLSLMNLQAFGQGQSLDTELTGLTEKLAARIKSAEKKKVAVLDFTDLQGNGNEFGKYLAEQLNLDFVMGEKNFSVLDRANLKSILAEHKLTAKGLVDPDNAKKLGMFAGVDALILGTMVPMNQDVELTAKIITTDTAEIVGAAKCKVKTDDFIKQLMARTNSVETRATESSTGEAPKSADAKIVKTSGDLRIELEPLRIADGSKYLLTMTLTNTSKERSAWAALSTLQNGTLKGSITDAEGYEFISGGNLVSGLAAVYLSYYDGDVLHEVTEIKPGDSTTVTVKFVSSNSSHLATIGACRLQLDIMTVKSFRGGAGAASTYNLTSELTVK